MIIYTVKNGDTLYSISEEFSVPLNILTELNPIGDPSRLSVGQSIVIRVPSELYTLCKGDSIQSVAKKFSITEQELIRSNPSLAFQKSLPVGKDVVISYEDSRPLKSITLAGYVYPSVGEKALSAALPFLSNIIPFAYGLDSIGNLVSLSDENTLRHAASLSVSPIMLLTTLNDNGIFDNTLSSLLLEDRELQENLLSQIIPMMQVKGYKSLLIDFEFVFPSEKELYADFLKTIRSRLADHGFSVWASLAPRESDFDNRLLSAAHDYSLIGAAVDKVVLMTYDWGYSHGRCVSASPLGHLKKTVEYAISRIPGSKIIIGIPGFGYDFALPCNDEQLQISQISYNDALALASDKNAEILFDSESAAPYFKYSDQKNEHLVIFEDARSVNARLSVVSEFDLCGVAIWNLSDEFTQAFSVINALFNIEKSR